MIWRDRIIAITIAILLSVLTVFLIDIIWRESVGEVAPAASLTGKPVYAEHDTPYLEAVKSPPGREAMFATWYDYSLSDAPEYSLTHATAASRTYPRETQLLVCTTKCVQVRVNDYGPEEWTGKDIDLSSFAFKQLAPLSRGVIVVEVREL